MVWHRLIESLSPWLLAVLKPCLTTLLKQRKEPWETKMQKTVTIYPVREYLESQKRILTLKWCCDSLKQWGHLRLNLDVFCIIWPRDRQEVQYYDFKMVWYNIKWQLLKTGFMKINVIIWIEKCLEPLGVSVRVLGEKPKRVFDFSIPTSHPYLGPQNIGDKGYYRANELWCLENIWSTHSFQQSIEIYLK